METITNEINRGLIPVVALILILIRRCSMMNVALHKYRVGRIGRMQISPHIRIQVTRLITVHQTAHTNITLEPFSPTA